MGKQSNKVIKRRRRKAYLKRKKELTKQGITRKSARPAKSAEADKKAAKKAPAKKAVKAAAKKAPAKPEVAAKPADAPVPVETPETVAPAAEPSEPAPAESAPTSEEQA